ncbi:MAG: glycoside hydrolase family 65 protein [Deltaproteobacteria bacterium]|nr:glycoside hydrolase family 65 protein [Deltaproteobacteria bacterium]
MNAWKFVYEGFEPEKEGLRETLCTLGNGYFATRGAAPECEPDETHYPGTYLAGGYNRLTTRIAGRKIENEDLVNLPNWVAMSFKHPGGKWFKPMAVDILSYRQELDLKKGVLTRTVRFQDKQGRETTANLERIVHMQKPHLAAQRLTVTPENWSGPLEFCTALDGRVINAGVDRYKALSSKHLTPLDSGQTDENTMYLDVVTVQSRIKVSMAARTRIFQDQSEREILPDARLEPDYVSQDYQVDLAEGRPVTMEKVVSLYTSRDKGISESGLQAREEVSRAPNFDELLQSHVLAWDHLWRRFEIQYESKKADHGGRTALILHLYVFHLLQTTSLHTRDMDVGVPARGWHGEAYRGHIFWDELYIIPMLNFRLPEITRGLLLYRYRRLERARENARKEGYAGAMFPWQSGSSGREESQELHLNPRSGRWMPDYSRHQHHVNSAIAYNVWQYYQTAWDGEFMAFYGAEMILEIARFWASIATYNEERKRYEIRGVIGPDEYHDAYPDSDRPGLNNNAYTNVTAVWCLLRALDLFQVLSESDIAEVVEKIGLERKEMELWEDITRKMFVPFHGDGIISQFEGYENLEEFDWEGYRKKYNDIQRLDRILEAEGDSPNHYKASKQADVLMLFYLFSSDELRGIFKRLGYSFEYETIPKNIEYYMSRTSHGSTLSRVVHSWILARGDRKKSWELFTEALESDVADIQGGTTPEGIHLGAMAGCADILQRAYTGLEARENILYINPVLPEGLVRFHMHIRYRGHSLGLDLLPDKVVLSTLSCMAGPVEIGFGGEIFLLEQGQTKELPLG